MNMVRYADDFILTGYSKEWLETESNLLWSNFWRNAACPIAGENQNSAHQGWV
jgi:hypothetical protein